MNLEDDTEIRRLVATALGTSLMQCRWTIEAAAEFLVSGNVHVINPPVDEYHELDRLVDEVLWGLATGNKGAIYSSCIKSLSELFPQDPDAQH